MSFSKVAPICVLSIALLLFTLFRAAEAQVISTCANKKGGELKLASGSCKKNQTALSWNIQGPAGPQGPPGLPALNAIALTGNSGFPIVIQQAGSYMLQGNLNPAANTDAIDLKADNVTIDLNGFAIIGSATQPSVWAIAGSSQSGTIVKNGSLNGLCPGLGPNSLIESVIALNCNSTDAIDVGSNSTVLRSQALNGHVEGIVCSIGQNGGINSGSNCLFSDDTAANNPGNGMNCGGSGCNFTRDTANGNGGDGLNCSGSGCLYEGNVADSNALYGVSAFDQTSAMTENVFSGNGAAPFWEASSLGTNLCNGTKC